MTTIKERLKAIEVHLATDKKEIITVRDRYHKLVEDIHGRLGMLDIEVKSAHQKMGFFEENFQHFLEDSAKRDEKMEATLTDLCKCMKDQTAINEKVNTELAKANTRREVTWENLCILSRVIAWASGLGVLSLGAKFCIEFFKTKG